MGQCGVPSRGGAGWIAGDGRVLKNAPTGQALGTYDVWQCVLMCRRSVAGEYARQRANKQVPAQNGGAQAGGMPQPAWRWCQKAWLAGSGWVQ